jgi:MbtH protein
MEREEEKDDTVYRVVVNHEEQYSIWPAHKALPPGWRDGGKTGGREECLDHIEVVWTDMRPLSLRQRMAQSEAKN